MKRSLIEWPAAPPAPADAGEQQRLAALHRLGVLDTPAESVFDDITALAALWCGTPAALISLVDSDRLWFKSSRGVGLREVPRTGSLCARVIAQDGLLHIEDTLRADVHPDAVALPGGRTARFYAGMPLKLSNGYNVGVLAVVAYAPHRLDQAQRESLERLARQAVAALEARQAALEMRLAGEKLQRRAAFNAMHARASQIIASSADEQPMLQAICDTAVQHGDIRLAFVSRPHARGMFEFIAHAGDGAYLEGLELHVDPAHPLGDGPVCRAWRSGQPYFAANLEQAAELRPWSERIRHSGFKSTATVPIFRGGKVWGTFTAHLGAEGAVDSESQGILVELALNLSQGLDRIDAQEREQELMELQGILLDNTLAGILIKRDRRIVSLNRRFANMLGYDAPEQLVGLSARVLYPDDAEFKRVEHLHADLLRDGVVRAMDIRVRRRDGSVLLCDAAGRWSRKSSARTMVWTFVDATERADLQDRLEHDALHDPLSELPNRRAVEHYLPRALARARRADKAFAVGLIDLDDFKPVNDTFGHEAGDTVLRELARRMGELARKGDMLARLGGDEFLVVLEELDPGQLPAQVEAALARLHRAVETPFDLGAGRQASIGMSVGVAAYPGDADDADSLLRQADAALYELKERKFERSSWWQIGTRGGDAGGDGRDPAEIEPYGPQADALLRTHGAALRQTMARFLEEFQAELGAEFPQPELVRCLSDSDWKLARRRYAEHLEFIVSPGVTAEALRARADSIGQMQALLGIDAAELIPPMAQLRRIAMQCAITQRVASRVRYQVLRLLEDRLQDDLQTQLRAASRTAGSYFRALTRPTALQPGTPWRDVLHHLLEPVGKLPGIMVCAVLRPGVQDRFEIEAATGPRADGLTSIMHTGEFSLPMRRDLPDEQGLVLPAWRTLEVQTTPDLQRDPRLIRWHRLARAAGARSAVAIPVAPNPGRCSMVLVLLGSYPHQFEAPWMRQFVRGLQSRASHAWRLARASASALVLAKDVAQGYRDRLLDGGLQMYLQPVVDLHTGRCLKAEALARLQLADGRIVAPGLFLPVLGEAELDRLFCLGLEQVCAQMRQWDVAGIAMDVAINLPPTSLLDPECPRWVESALSRHGIRPSRLTLELLETQEVDFHVQEAALRSLKSLGVRLAMDDLGAGYSNLQRLAQLPFDVIKLDQSISLNIRKDPLQTLSLMRSIVRLAAELGRELVVEGVEDRGVIEAALECGARYAQGYGLARPMPASAFLEWLRDFRLEVRPGEIATYLGVLARCASRKPVPHPGHAVVPRHRDGDPVPGFLAGRAGEHGEFARWYAGGSSDDARDATADGQWLEWLARKARAEGDVGMPPQAA